MADMHLATASRGNCTPMCHGPCVTGKTIVVSGIDKTKGNTRANVAFSPSHGVQPSLTFRQFCPSFVGAWRPITTEPRQQQSNSMWSAGSAAQPANRAFLFEAPVAYKLIPSDLAKAIVCIWEEGTCLKRSPSTRSPSFSVHASVRILRGRTLKRGETACMPSHMVPDQPEFALLQSELLALRNISGLSSARGPTKAPQSRSPSSPFTPHVKKSSVKRPSRKRCYVKKRQVHDPQGKCPRVVG